MSEEILTSAAQEDTTEDDHNRRIGLQEHCMAELPYHLIFPIGCFGRSGLVSPPAFV
jgi:hypothetical protein